MLQLHLLLKKQKTTTIVRLSNAISKRTKFILLYMLRYSTILIMLTY